MRRLWNEFKSFAMSGNMLDLALGFIIGGAFATLIQSLVTNVLLQSVAVVFHQPKFVDVSIDIHGSKIFYGKFINDLVNFLLLTAVLFGVVKFIVFIGLGRGRAFGSQECPYCEESVSPTALVCKFCRQPLVDELPSLTDARTRFDELRRRRLPVPIGLPLGILPVPGRRKPKDVEPVSSVNEPVSPVVEEHERNRP